MILALAALVAGGAGLVAGGLVDVDRAESSPAPAGPPPYAARPAIPAPPVLPTAPAAVAGPSRVGVAGVLDPLLADPALGAGVSATVTDVASGRVVYDRAGARPRIPASVAKLVTAAAVLDRPGPDAHLATTVTTGSRPGQVVLVGGGDPTLTVDGTARTGDYPAFARLDRLADETAAWLRGRGRGTVRVGVDATLFTGPAQPPDWPVGYVSGGVVGPVSALSVDGGRRAPGGTDDSREVDPARAAGERFAGLLAERGVTVRGAVGPARAGVEVLAQELSPPVRVLVEHLLATSDNDLAEALARHAAIAAGHPGSAAGTRRVLAATLRDLGATGDRLADGSGLARTSQLSTRAVSALLARAAAGADRDQRVLVAGLPVAGFTGTLAERFAEPDTAAAAGLVRAKTGTLTGVSALAGTVVDADGRLLAFAVLADAVPDTLGARAALDEVAAALAACGCR